MTRAHDYRLCIAPMMDWTDRHFRFFVRLITRHARLYTEMVTADAVLHGDRERLIDFDPAEHPVALQLGGSDPARLAEAARIGADFGYDEINLNVGCPSDRVQSARFGACLMREPDLVARCVEAMAAAVSVPVTVKCRIGVDEQDPEEALPALLDAIEEAGCDTAAIHARKAWLQGLSPKENRDVPPLDYKLVYRIKQARPDLVVVVNGGIGTLEEAEAHIASVDGVMLGRLAYHDPYALADAGQRLFADPTPPPERAEVVGHMLSYTERHCAAGRPLHAVTRHMLGLFQGQPGARAWRRHLTTEGVKKGAGPEVLEEALRLVEKEQERFAARRRTAERRVAALASTDTPAGTEIA